MEKLEEVLASWHPWLAGWCNDDFLTKKWWFHVVSVTFSVTFKLILCHYVTVGEVNLPV